MIKHCICKACGSYFNGGPRAWYCPSCRTERRKVAEKRHRLKKLAGEARKLGDKDVCVYCGKEYTIEGPNQRMCPDCKPEKYAEHDRETAIVYYHENKKESNPKRNKKRRIDGHIKICSECGEKFLTNKRNLTCSEKCKRVRKNRLWREANKRRKNKISLKI